MTCQCSVRWPPSYSLHVCNNPGYFNTVSWLVVSEPYHARFRCSAHHDTNVPPSPPTEQSLFTKRSVHGSGVCSNGLVQDCAISSALQSYTKPSTWYGSPLSRGTVSGGNSLVGIRRRNLIQKIPLMITSGFLTWPSCNRCFLFTP